VAELGFAVDRPEDFLPCFAQASELTQGVGDIAPRGAFPGDVAAFNKLVSCPARSLSRTLIANELR